MAEIRNLTRNGETFYPLTCTEGLVNRDGNVVGEINDIFDISEYNASGTPPILAKYTSLSLALASVPSSKQKGGMTIRYVQNSDNKYVQYRLMSDSFNTTVVNWQKEDLDIIPDYVGTHTPFIVRDYTFWYSLASGATKDGDTFTFATNAVASSYIGVDGETVRKRVASFAGKKVRVEFVFKVSGDYAHLTSGDLFLHNGTYTAQGKDVSGTTWKFWADLVVTSSWQHIYVRFSMLQAIDSAVLEFTGVNCYLSENENYDESTNAELIKTICKENNDREIKEHLIYCFSTSGTDDSTHFHGLKSIANALNSINDATYNNRYRLIIDGYFHFTNPLDLISVGEGEYSVAFCKPFVSLEGTGKDKCVIFVDIAPNSTFHDGKTWYDYQPIYISCEGEVNVSNMTIIGKNCRYTIHLERDPDRIGGVKRTIKNCNVIHLGLDGYQNAGFCHAFGTGMGYDHVWNIEDCYIESAISSSFAMHSELGLPAYRQGIVNFKNNTFKGNINFSEYPQNSEAFVNFIGSNVFKDTFIGVVPMYRAGMYKLGNYMTTKIKMDNVAIPVYNNFFRGMVLRFDAVNDNQTITILSSPSVSSAFVDIIGNSLDRGIYLTDECFIAEYGYFRREGSSNFKAFAFGSIDCDESETTGYRSLGKLLGDCSGTNKKLTLNIGGTFKTITFSEDLSSKDNAYVLNIINTALSGFAVASVFCPARYQYPEVKGLYKVVCTESTPILRGMGVVYTSGGVRKATNADGYIDGIALDDFGQNQYGRIITEGSIYANHKRDITYYFFTTLESNNTQRNVGDALGISITDTGIFDIDATPKVLRATGIDILKIL